MHKIFGGEAMMSFWYHFAIMFEALFILTSVDAGTRVARFMLSDALGNFWPRLKDHSWKVGSWLTTAIMVAGWGSILLMGVTDPLGASTLSSRSSALPTSCWQLSPCRSAW